MTESRKLRVFLCHSSQDKPIVRELYQRLNAEGWIDPWLDEEKLLPGQDWDMEIEKAVKAADVIIICLSSTSISKEGYVQKEIKTALNVALFMPEESIYIVPLRLNDCPIPHNLRSIQYVDFFPRERKEWVYVRLFQSLKIRLEQVIARDAADLVTEEQKRQERKTVEDDTRRDADKYYKFLLAIESATEKIGTLEKAGRASIDEVLAHLLPDLVDALDAAQAFVLVCQPDNKSQKKGFDVVAAYPTIGSGESFLPQSKLLDQVLSDGRARVVEPFGDAPKKLIHGLEVFQAVTAILVRMQVEGPTRIIGVCNRSSPKMGPFLAADRRALESIIELIAIGLRTGERRK